MPAQTIKVRKDGRFLVRYHGKLFYGYTKSEAIAKRDEYKILEAQGKVLDPKNPSFRDYAERWQKTYKANVAPGTKRMYRTFTTKVCDALGDLKLKDITQTDIMAAYNTLAGSSDSTCRKFAMTLNAILEAAVADNLISRNPGKGAKRPKGPEGSHRCLEDWEKELVEQAAEEGKHRFSLAAVTMLYSGIRRGEAAALNIDEDIDFENDLIHVTKAISFDGNKGTVSTTKTEAGVRYIPLMPKLKQFLQGRHGLLLPGKDGKLITETALTELVASYNNELSRIANGGLQRRWWGKTKAHKAILNAGGTLLDYREVNIRCHDFRHTFCTMLYEAGVDLKTAQRWMGHADEKMIMQVYAHLTEKQEQKNVDRLKEYLAG